MAVRHPSEKIGYVLSIVLAVYLLPIWINAFYLAITGTQESGAREVMDGLIALGVLIVPVLAFGALMFTIVGWIQKPVQKRHVFISLAILGASVIISLVALLALST